MCTGRSSAGSLVFGATSSATSLSSRWPQIRRMRRGSTVSPLLFFDNDADRRRAHGSPEMAACDIDSRQFIGAVSRVITQPVEVVLRSASAGSIGLMILYHERTDAAAIEAHLADMKSKSKLRGLTRYHVLDQGPAPNSTVPHLAIAVSLMAQAWFDSTADIQTALAVRNEAGAAVFVIEEHRLV